MNQKIFLREEVGTNPADLGPRPSPYLNPSLPFESYSVVVAADRIFEVKRPEDAKPPEVIESDIFGFPVADSRILLFADTNAYGIDERKWVLDASTTPENLVPANLQLWFTTGNPAVNDIAAFYKGLDTKTEYGSTSIDLSIPASQTELDRFVLCSTKQTFDCPGASNLFVSFGMQCDTIIGNIKRAGLFSKSTGWYLEINGNGQGNNFSIVHRYRDIDGEVKDKLYPRFSNVFRDKLDGSGSSRLAVDFTLVAMYAIEVGSYDGTAVRFYIYARDNAQGGSHRWIMFAAIPTSDVSSYVERNPVSLPVTFELRGDGSSDAYLNKYGTSVTKSGSENSPLKIFSAPGVRKELVAEKEVFSMGLLTKELFNLQSNTAQQFPKYLTVNSSVPVEVVVRRTLIDESNILGFPFLPPLDERFNLDESLFLVADNAILLCSLENQSVYQKLTIDGGYELIAFDSQRNYIYATQRDNANLIVINALTGGIINRIPGGNRAIPSDIRIAGNKLFVIHPANNNVTAWDLSTINQPNPNPTIINVGTNPQKMVDGDGKIFVTNRNTNNISVINANNPTLAVTTISDIGLNEPFAIAFNRGILYITNLGSTFVRIYDTGTAPGTRLTAREFSLQDIITQPKLIEYVDSIDKIYVVGSGGKMAIADYFESFPTDAPAVSLFNYEKDIAALSVSPQLDLFIFDGSLVFNFDTNEILIDTQSPINQLRDQLSQSGVSPILHPRFQSTGEKIFSFISSGGKQFSLTKIFQEYREFFSSSFDNFRDNKTISQDMILFYLKNIGELLSKSSNQIEWVEGSSNNSNPDDDITESYSSPNDYPPFVSNSGFGTLSLISSQY